MPPAIHCFQGSLGLALQAGWDQLPLGLHSPAEPSVALASLRDFHPLPLGRLWWVRTRVLGRSHPALSWGSGSLGCWSWLGVPQPVEPVL